MRAFDLTTAAARLDMAIQALAAAKTEVQELWNDQAIANMREEYLDPLEPKVRRALEAIRNLSQVLSAAQRDCETR